MPDAFLLGAGFSKAIANDMPTMKELYDHIEMLVDNVEGLTRNVYEYANGNVETLLSYFAIPTPQDDELEVLL